MRLFRPELCSLLGEVDLGLLNGSIPWRKCDLFTARPPLKQRQ